MKPAIPGWFLRERDSIVALRDRLRDAKPPHAEDVAAMEAMLEIGEKLCNDQDCKFVWDAIDALVGRSDWSPRVVGLMADGEDSRDYWLMHAMYHAKHGFRGAERMTPAERKKFAAEIATSARVLAGALPRARRISRRVWNHFRIEARSPIEWPAPNYGADYLPSALEILAQSAEQWANEFQPVVEQPGRENAERNFFIRQMAQEFRESLGQPLHQVNLILTRCLGYSIETLDEAAISRLTSPKT